MVAYGFFAALMGLALFSIVWIGLSIGVNEIGDSFNNVFVKSDMPVSQQTADTTSGLITFWNAAPVFCLLGVFLWSVVRSLEKKED